MSWGIVVRDSQGKPLGHVGRRKDGFWVAFNGLQQWGPFASQSGAEQALRDNVR